MKFIQIDDSCVRRDAIAAILPDHGDHIHGVAVREADPNRCRLLTIGGTTITVPHSVDHVRALLEA